MDEARLAPHGPLGRFGELAVVVLVGGATWCLVVASEPHTTSCGGPKCENWFGGEPVELIPAALVQVIWFVGLPLVFGWRHRLGAFTIGIASVSVALLTAAWMTPRGDEDGLWVLILPFLVVGGVAIAGVAALGRWARRRWTP